MLPPVRIFAIVLRWLALGCSVIAAISGGAALLLDKGIGAGFGMVAFASAILLWSVGETLDYWITRHARRRLRMLMATVAIQEDLIQGTPLEQKEFCASGKLPIRHLATAPSSQGTE